MSPTADRPTALVVVIGPSGSGKSTAVRSLVDRGVVRVHPTWTTRPRRPDEHAGSAEHRFVDAAEFDALVHRRFFLDTVELFGLPHRYGLPRIDRSTDGRADVVMLRAPLVERFRAVVPDPAIVIQIESDPHRTADRLRRRGTGEADVLARLVDNEREAVLGRAVADVVVTNDGSIDELVDRLQRVIRAAAATTGAEVAA